MSYILEALTRSEQARQQAAAAPKYSLLPAIGGEISQQRRWPYALAGALAVNAAVMYLWLRPTLPAGVPVAAASAVMRSVETPVAPAAQLPASAPVPRWDKPAVASPAQQEARPRQSPPALVSERVAAPTPAPAKPPSAKASKKPEVDPVKAAKPAPPVAAKRSAPPETAAAPAPAAAAAQRKEAAGPAPVPVVAQPELPHVSVSGFIRDGGAGGMVIVNDKLVREGDEVAPGLKLEQILHDSLVFNYNGYRFKR
ncbi:MAG: general secretion pathway protein GspB [Betaproteobacteria bacterium]|nr:general secretion pathway protein GspB [Betaproteobacteria bacterium]